MRGVGFDHVFVCSYVVCTDMCMLVIVLCCAVLSSHLVLSLSCVGQPLEKIKEILSKGTKAEGAATATTTTATAEKKEEKTDAK